MGSYSAKTKRARERGDANMMPSVLFDDILFKFLHFVLLAFCVSFPASFRSCHRRRTSESKQKNDISINNWTFRYAFFGFLCLKNAKTQQEIFCVCVSRYVFHTFQVANSRKRKRQREHFARSLRWAQIHSICIWMCNEHFAGNVHERFPLSFDVYNSKIQLKLCTAHRLSYFLFFGHVFHQCPLNINVYGAHNQRK